jgi:flagellar biosynthesis/type III secretory pathway chaperone
MVHSLARRIDRIEKETGRDKQIIEEIKFVDNDEAMTCYQKEWAALGEAEQAGQKIDLDRKTLLQKRFERSEHAKNMTSSEILAGILDY